MNTPAEILDLLNQGIPITQALTEITTQKQRADEQERGKTKLHDQRFAELATQTAGSVLDGGKISKGLRDEVRELETEITHWKALNHGLDLREADARDRKAAWKEAVREALHRWIKAETDANRQQFAFALNSFIETIRPMIGKARGLNDGRITNACYDAQLNAPGSGRNAFHCLRQPDEEMLEAGCEYQSVISRVEKALRD
jgi:hypothetical protein